MPAKTTPPEIRTKNDNVQFPVVSVDNPMLLSKIWSNTRMCPTVKCCDCKRSGPLDLFSQHERLYEKDKMTRRVGPARSVIGKLNGRYSLQFLEI